MTHHPQPLGQGYLQLLLLLAGPQELTVQAATLAQALPLLPPPLPLPLLLLRLLTDGQVTWALTRAGASLVKRPTAGCLTA